MRSPFHLCFTCACGRRLLVSGNLALVNYRHSSELNSAGDMSALECLFDNGEGDLAIESCSQPGNVTVTGIGLSTGMNAALETNGICLTYRSTKGASKQRRDLINGEIVKLRELLPLSEAARQRLSQLQVMSFASVYIRKCNDFTRREYTFSLRFV